MVIFNDLDTIYEWMDMIDFEKDIETIKNYDWFKLATRYIWYLNVVV